MDTGQHHTGSGFRNVHNNNFTLRVETEMRPIATRNKKWWVEGGIVKLRHLWSNGLQYL